MVSTERENRAIAQKEKTMTKREKQIVNELIEQATKYRKLSKDCYGYAKGVQDGLEFAINIIAEIGCDPLASDKK